MEDTLRTEAQAPCAWGGEAGQAVVCGCQSGRWAGSCTLQGLSSARATRKNSRGSQSAGVGCPQPSPVSAGGGPAGDRVSRPGWCFSQPHHLICTSCHLSLGRGRGGHGACFLLSRDSLPVLRSARLTPDAVACGAAAGAWARCPPWGAALLPPGGALQRPDA